jgi:glycosyltransferase involved in cell wall biosynthesis
MFEGGQREIALRDAGVPVVHLGFCRFGTRWLIARNAAAFGRLVLFLRRDRPDVLHAFLPHSYLIATPAARIARVPVFVAGRRSLGTFKEGRTLLLATERLATRATDLLIANATAVAADTVRQERVSVAKVAVVYNGLPESAFAEQPPADIDAANPIVLCVANLKAYKGHHYLLEAVARLQSQGRPCTLLLAGDGEARVELEHHAAQLKLDARFLGQSTQVGRLLARADVVVLPSLQEGMSNAVMEAMAAGRPVVATNVGGTPELLEGRGILVRPSDSKALADAIERMLADRSYASRMATRAKLWSRENLHANRMVDEHVRIYSDLLRRKCAG